MDKKRGVGGHLLIDDDRLISSVRERSLVAIIEVEPHPFYPTFMGINSSQSYATFAC